MVVNSKNSAPRGAIYLNNKLLVVLYMRRCSRDG